MREVHAPVQSGRVDLDLRIPSYVISHVVNRTVTAKSSADVRGTQ
jgi:hypothetical protein